ncbi:MAG: polysaccharide biosynthesis/export family protein, partial [Myxococcota bacterium]
MNRLATLAMIFIVATGAACAKGVPNFPYEKEPDPRGAEYVLGVSDTLEISVWKNRDLNTTATVRPDGTITMPL